MSENTELFDLEPAHSVAHPQVRRVKNPGHNDAFARVYPASSFVQLLPPCSSC